MNNPKCKNPIKEKPARQAGHSARESRQMTLLLFMNYLSSIRSSAICIILAFLFLTQGSIAQVVTNQGFVVATPPEGLIKGVIKAGNRSGVLVAGGKTVYSNDTFTVTTRGHQVIWKVIGFPNNQPQFARLLLSSPSPYSTSLDCSPNFNKLVMLLESEANLYKAASTKILRDQVIATTRKRVEEWCKTNTLCVVATVADISAVDDKTVKIKLSNVNRGEFDRIRYPSVSLWGPTHITVPMTRDKAGLLKAGYRVVLSGIPSFNPGTDNIMGDGFLQQSGFVSFRFSLIGDPRFVGAVNLNQVKYDVFDPKLETAP